MHANSTNPLVYQPAVETAGRRRSCKIMTHTHHIVGVGDSPCRRGPLPHADRAGVYPLAPRSGVCVGHRQGYAEGTRCAIGVLGMLRCAHAAIPERPVPAVRCPTRRGGVREAHPQRRAARRRRQPFGFAQGKPQPCFVIATNYLPPTDISIALLPPSLSFHKLSPIQLPDISPLPAA